MLIKYNNYHIYIVDIEQISSLSLICLIVAQLYWFVLGYIILMTSYSFGYQITICHTTIAYITVTVTYFLLILEMINI